jgi:hypothetical protein
MCRLRAHTTEVTEMMTKRATNLSSMEDSLADGAIVLHLSIQLNWVYVKVITPNGHFRTRRYRHDQQVKVI